MTLQQYHHAEQVNQNSTDVNFGTESEPTHAQTKPKATLERLKQQQKMLANRISQLESRQRQNERKQETRRKILVGAYYLDTARKTGTIVELNKKMTEFLTRASDKVLFCLPIHNDNVPSK